MSNLRTLANSEIAKQKRALLGKRGKADTKLNLTAEKTASHQKIKTKKVAGHKTTVSGKDAVQTLTQSYLNQREQTAAKDESEWRQYKPGVEEGIPEDKTVNLNAATVRAMAKKLIANEWRRARGKPRKDIKGDQLLREAVNWHEKNEQERKRKEDKQQKLINCANKLDQLLKDFSQSLIEAAGGIDPDNAENAFKEALENLGVIYRTDWSESGCRIWFEPWSGVRSRRVSSSPDPVIYSATIDAGLNITSFTESEHLKLHTDLHEELTRTFEALMEGNHAVDLNLDNILEEAVSELGRIESMSKTNNGWEASFEPWAEIRLRKRRRIEEASASLTQIVINQSRGKLTFHIDQVQNKE